LALELGLVLDLVLALALVLAQGRRSVQRRVLEWALVAALALDLVLVRAQEPEPDLALVLLPAWAPLAPPEPALDPPQMALSPQESPLPPTQLELLPQPKAMSSLVQGPQPWPWLVSIQGLVIPFTATIVLMEDPGTEKPAMAITEDLDSGQALGPWETQAIWLLPISHWPALRIKAVIWSDYSRLNPALVQGSAALVPEIVTPEWAGEPLLQ
jgi:hypothetical protein